MRTRVFLDQQIFLVCFWLVAGFLIALIYFQNASPPLSDDALIYHLPAAVQWLKTGWLGTYDAWFVNPANTYSPLAGSVLMTWWIAPVGCDVLVRTCQMPALILIFFAMSELLTSLGLRRGNAAIVAAATVLCRPFVSQTILVKDDLFVAAFFLCFVAGCARGRLEDRLAPWRLGVAAGLMLAMKYTVLLSVPLLLLLIDAPWRARWTAGRWLIVLILILLLAGPWYVRNWIITGNPIFPVPLKIAGVELFSGLFRIQGNDEMRALSGLWGTFTEKYFGISPWMIGAVIVLWLASLILHGRAILRDPLKRICILGGPVGIGLFVFGAHLNEMRYAYPAMLLFFVAAGMSLNGNIGRILAGILLLLSIGTAFVEKDLVLIIGGIAAGVMILAIAEAELTRRLGRRVRIASVAILAIFVSLWLYVEYPAYLLRCEATASELWVDRYGKQGELWKWARENLPRDARIATAHVVLPYPLYGYRFTREARYVPASGFSHYHDWPQGNVALTDQQLRPWVADRIAAFPVDLPQWRTKLGADGWQYLYIERQHGIPAPREWEYAAARPSDFELIFANDAGRVYRIR